MKAACIESFGGPWHIRYVDLPDPEPGPGEVLVRAEAVAVNTVDDAARHGLTGPLAAPLSAPVKLTSGVMD